jgi:hypothetical protein
MKSSWTIQNSIYIERISNLQNDRDAFIFHYCSKTLERVSIRNAKYSTFNHNYGVCVPQSALVKFIRNGPPTLRWFRSDLSKENITMLQNERPEIKFLN